MKFRKIQIFSILLLPCILFAAGLEVRPVRTSTLNPQILSRIDQLVQKGLNAKAFPGCQVLVLKDGKIVYDRSFGFYTYEGNQKVTSETLYDVASLTKVAGTLLAVMKLYDAGKLRLEDKASSFLPFLKNTNKENITIRQLLLHETGLPPSLNLNRMVTTKDPLHQLLFGSTFYRDSLVSRCYTVNFGLQVSDSLWLRNDLHEVAMNQIAQMPLGRPTYLYSCVNFMLLKEVIESIAGEPMNEFLNREFYAPMGLRNTAFHPLTLHDKLEIAPTLSRDFLRDGMVQGFVQDPDAALLGGVSGNAGLFSTSSDVAKIFQLFLYDGVVDGVRYLKAETCKLFTTTTSDTKRRALGFDKSVPSNPKHSPCSISTPASVYGHTGYTGTCCWVDPDHKMIYVFLSNRTYPNDGVNKLARMNIRTDIQELLYQSIKEK